MLVLCLQTIDWVQLRGKKVSPPFLPHLDIISADDVDENQFGVASDPRSAGTWRPRSNDPFKVRTRKFPTFIACRIRTRLISGPFRTRVGSRGSRSLRGVTVSNNSDVIIRPWPIFVHRNSGLTDRFFIFMGLLSVLQWRYEFINFFPNTHFSDLTNAAVKTFQHKRILLKCDFSNFYCRTSHLCRHPWTRPPWSVQPQ